jgi:hypothetical protein
MKKKRWRPQTDSEFGMKYEVSDEHRAIFEKLGVFRLTMMMSNGRVVHHLMTPAENWLAEQAERAAKEKDDAPAQG